MKRIEMTLNEVLKPGSKVAFYARVSTDKQDCQTQIDSVRRFLHNYDIEILKEHEYYDPATSATKIAIAHRKNLQRLIEATESKAFDFIAVFDYSRIARDTLEHQEMRKKMFELDMPVVITQTPELYTSVDVVTTAIKDGMTRMEYENIRERTSETLKMKQANGQWVGGKAPFGYKYDSSTKNFSIIESERIIVEAIFKMFKKGFGFSEIANKILENHADGVQKWNKDKVKMIITNPFYAGFIASRRIKKNCLTDRSNWILGRNTSIVPVISIEEWEYIMQLYDRKLRKKHNPKQLNTPFLLKELLQCGQCRQFLKTKNSEKKVRGKDYGRSYYFCDSENCRYVIDIKLIHDYFKKNFLDTILSTFKQRAMDVAKNQLKQELNEIIETIHRYEKHIQEHNLILAKTNLKITKLQNALSSEEEKELIFIESLIHYHMVKNTELEAMKEQIGQLIRKKEELEIAARYADSCNSVSNHLDEKDPLLIRRLLLELVSNILIDDNQKLHVELKTMDLIEKPRA